MKIIRYDLVVQALFYSACGAALFCGYHVEFLVMMLIRFAFSLFVSFLPVQY